MKKQFKFNPILSNSFLGVALVSALGLAQVEAGAILNGDFEAGATGFSSAYTYVAPAPSSLFPAGVYTVDNNPFDSHPFFYSMGDHTTGSGQMMIINGATTTGISVWEGTSTVPLIVGHEYDFSAWVASVNPTSPAVLTFRVGTSDLGTLSPNPDGSWKRLFATFTATETSPVFRLVNANGAASGNDFAIDDIDIFLGRTTTPIPTPDAGPGLAGLLTLLSLCGFRLRQSLCHQRVK